MGASEAVTLSSDQLRLEVSIADDRVVVRLVHGHGPTGLLLADGPYWYRASRREKEGLVVSDRLAEPILRRDGESVTITGRLAGLELSQVYALRTGRPFLEERITLRNAGGQPVRLEALDLGPVLRITDPYGSIPAAMAADRLVAVPFRHRPPDPDGVDQDWALADLLRLFGREQRSTISPLAWPQHGWVPSSRRGSEGWAWERGVYALGVYKLNQEVMEYSVVSTEPDADGVWLRFGGAGLFSGEPSTLGEIAPGKTVQLGITRYQVVPNDRREAWYGFRGFLDEHGCGYPKAFDPPVHWNELYDNAEWNLATPGTPKLKGSTRALTYTRQALELEAAKAAAYGCQSLYLDPGWDTAFGSLQWGEAWLGNRREFIEGIRQRYGLGLSLHCPLATWMSMDGRGIAAWPREAYQKSKDGKVLEGAVCLGSRQYLDEAERRLSEHCADGVVYLMFDGNWWNGGCWNPDHGHPVPYTMQDHARAQFELARRIHRKHPSVIIEQHDPISGGVLHRHSPVYFGYGPGSFDVSWGFELMWQPMEDILSGRARSLYWYNLGCNVPVYLHIDLRDDNANLLVLWWYASTCRHLGIGGTHAIPAVARAHQEAMARYRRLDRFYKRGVFYGAHEEAHIHVLPEENGFVVNLFNLSPHERVIECSVRFDRLGLDPDRWYWMPQAGRVDKPSQSFILAKRLPPWSAHVAEVRSIEAAS